MGVERKTLEGHPCVAPIGTMVFEIIAYMTLAMVPVGISIHIGCIISIQLLLGKVAEILMRRNRCVRRVTRGKAGHRHLLATVGHHR